MDKHRGFVRRYFDRLGWIAGGAIIAMVIGVGVAGATNGGGAFDNYQQDQAVGQQNQITGPLIKTEPAPIVTYSVERQNLIQRYRTFSDRNKVSYIALVNQQGGIVYSGVVKGKVSSVSSQLTPADRAYCVGSGNQGNSCVTVQLPEPDGSWATNGGGIFWFDQNGVYHEWNGLYLTADAPFTLTQPPVLTIGAQATPSNPAAH